MSEESFDEEAYLRQFKRMCAKCGIVKFEQYFHGNDELCAPCRHERGKVVKPDPTKEAFFAGWEAGFHDGHADATALVCTPTVERAWEDYTRVQARKGD